jgi:dolichol-phosphate mannosyltransferase
MADSDIELLVVMPVYNEQASIRKVVTEWFFELDRVAVKFKLLVIDDGSTDSTPAILKEVQFEFGSRLECHSRENRGHGQSCLQGYRLAVERGILYVFQIDSDGQCDPVYFKRFWDLREAYEVIYGKRTRKDGFRRKFASLVLRATLLLLFRVNCVDANVPYRLMNTHKCAPAFDAIPGDLFLANAALAVLLRKMHGLRHGTVDIEFLERYGGEPSVPLSKFAAKGIELFKQLAPMLTLRKNT